MPKATTSVRVPFHGNLFYCAMIGLVGRIPDLKTERGYDGEYFYQYVPQGAEEEKLFVHHADALTSWLDLFDVRFPETRVTYAPSDQKRDKGKKVLKILISHPVEKPANRR
jgi:hypothetical protein